LEASLVPYLKPVLWPIEEKDFADHWEEGVCRQSTFSTCGPASLATILSSYRVNVAEREIARSAHSYQGGTEAWYLARYARAKRMETHFVFRESFDPQVSFPAIVGVKIGASGHFIAVLDCVGEKVTVADPLYGRETLSLDEFHKRYRFTGFHLAVARTDCGCE
jgi:predicted double-glycine peptidase